MKLESNVSTDLQTHTVFCVDVSGSMHASLPKLKQQLKNKVATIVSQNIFSLIYFSGRTESGIIFQQLKSGNLSVVNMVLIAIENMLNCIGLTAFKKPLLLAKNVVKEGYTNRLVFMTDGYNNDVPFEEVLEALRGLRGIYDEVIFVEYGNYADTARLNKMAAEIGGMVVSCEDFEDMSNTLLYYMDNKAIGKKRKIKFDTHMPIVRVVDNENNVTFSKVVDGEIEIPANAAYVFANDPLEVKIPAKFNSMDITDFLTYVAYLVKYDTQRVTAYLKEGGETELIALWNKSFGKQAINKFLQVVDDKIKGKLSVIYEDFNDKRLPAVMTILQKLSEKGNYVYPHMMDYQRMSKGMVVKETEIVLEGTPSEIKAKLAAHKEPSFVVNNPEMGVELDGLVFSSERANVSLRVIYTGKVIDIPENEFGITEYPSHIYRNYNIFKDGILHTKKLYVTLTQNTELWLESYGLLDVTETDGILELDLSLCPMIEPESIYEMKSTDIIETAFILEQRKAWNKVFRHFSKEVEASQEISPEKEFLKSMGITDNGYNPLKATAPSTDFYVALSFNVAFKGLSNLPSVAKVLEKVEIAKTSGKPLNLGESLIHEALKSYEAMKTLGEDAITGFARQTNISKRNQELSLAKQVMNLILSRQWFSDRTDFDDNEFDLNIGGYEVTGKLKLEETNVVI